MIKQDGLLVAFCSDTYAANTSMKKPQICKGETIGQAIVVKAYLSSRYDLVSNEKVEPDLENSLSTTSIYCALSL